MSCKADRGLDSPDSGLPPSPSPSAWLLPGHADKEESKVSLVPLQHTGPLPQHHPYLFGEGISLNPLPAKEMRYISSVRHDSDRHFIQNVALLPWGQGLEHCRQTIMAMPHSTWRHYKTQLDFEPRHRPSQFRSTTIIYPKKTSLVYTTELNYDNHRLARHFISSVEFDASGCRKSIAYIK